MIATCTPQKANEIIAGQTGLQLIDVREFPEYAAGHVPGTRLIPLGQVAARTGEIDKSRPVLVLCKSGTRAAKAAAILAAAGFADVTVVAGGTDAWIAAGLPVNREKKAPWALERQVRLVAGLLVLIGLFIPPWPWLSLAVGAGLTIASLTNTCMMGLLLAKMPWNRDPAPCSAGSCCGK